MIYWGTPPPPFSPNKTIMPSQVNTGEEEGVEGERQEGEEEEGEKEEGERQEEEGERQEGEEGERQYLRVARQTGVEAASHTERLQLCT